MEKRICIFWLGHKKASGGAVVEAYDLAEACVKVHWNKADVTVKKVRILKGE